MSTGAVTAAPGVRRLKPSDFKPKPMASLASLARAQDLAKQLADSLSASLKTRLPGPWQIAVEGIDDSVPREDVEGSLTTLVKAGPDPEGTRLCVDLPLVSALVDCALGGSGEEEPYQIGDRPLSAIETGLLSLALGQLGAAAAAVLAAYRTEEQSPRETERGSDCAAFRFLVNLHSGSGEIRLSCSRDMLLVALGDASDKYAGSAQSMPKRAALNSPPITFTVMLKPQTLPVEAIAALKIGSTMKLNARTTDEVIVMSGSRKIYTATLGQMGGQLAATLVTPEQE